MSEEEGLGTGRVLLRDSDQLVSVDEDCPIVDVASRHHVVYVRSGASTAAAMVQPEDVVASLGEMLDDTIVTTLVLIRADDNDDAALGTCHQVLLGEAFSLPLIP